MIFLKYINRFFLFCLTVILVYISFLLASNTSRGFDITDESYYVLAAQHPEKIFSVVTHEGYYTNLLYRLSGYNLSNFRLIGILILISISVWFGVTLYKYILKKNYYTNDSWDKFLFVVAVSIGSLSYYKLWLITPSYNWLSLVSILLFFISLFCIVNNKEQNNNKYITKDYILLSFSLALAFMAKPTTALLLMIVSFLFIFYEFKNINLKRALPSVIILTSLIVAAHILILDNGFDNYYEKLTESMERMSLMGGGHTLGSRYTDMVKLLQEFFFDKFYFHQINQLFIYGFLLVVSLLFIFRTKINALNIYLIVILVVLFSYGYMMFYNGLDDNLKLLWFRSVELLFLNFGLIMFATLFVNQKRAYIIKLLKIVPLLFILILGSFAYKFGSNNQIIYAMSESMLFVVGAFLVLNFTFDKELSINIFLGLSVFIVSIFIYYSIQYAYKHPYRLITSIKKQTEDVALLGGLRVDKMTKTYIESLQKIKNNNVSKDKKISLIDITGGSPGANVILNADFFDSQWLIGGYPGSNIYVKRILKTYKNTQKFKEAWILISPQGTRKLDLKILNQLGLNFPYAYKKIGTFTTAHRNEKQELWIPVSKLVK